MYKQVLDPVSHSLGLTAIFAVLPLLVLFILLGGFRMKAQWASLIALGVSILIALIVYSMPIGQAGDAALEGAAFGLWPIMWIVINALWIFNMTDATGYFAILRRAFNSVSDDPRVQVVVIAFCFGALLEALAGFGTPVAICGVMLVGIGFSPLRAASLALVADTAPVAFGAIAIPITTLAQVTGLPAHDLGAMVGRQTPFLALIVPFALVFMADGRRGVRAAWPAALTAGVVFALLQFVTSNYISIQLTDIVAALGSAAAVVALVQVWSPHTPATGAPTVGQRPAIAGGEAADATFERRTMAEQGPPPSRRDMFLAFAPYLIIIVVLGITSITGITKELDKATNAFHWPGLHVLNAKGKVPTSETFKLNYLTAAGTWLFVSGLLTALVLRVRPGQAVRIYWRTIVELRSAIVTVAAVLALAYVMNLSGQTITLGTWAAGAGGFFAFLSPLIGWFGTAVTGSDTSTNSLFGALQVAAAHKANLSPTLMAAANSSGGVLAKMVSPQNLAIGAAAVGLAGREGDIFRQVIGYSIVFVLLMAVLVLLQSGPLSFMVP
ncbi:MAG: L-lactate permease [Solirubrobacterales bacterium]|nr:L-lactate permease [Solirubrobacterales bacterium]MBV9365685.1 L-lactate permease [Solirubrobacterales bacterium]MBV9807864.1 L-lactate permease [Solirubrobacterales bacterium]